MFWRLENFRKLDTREFWKIGTRVTIFLGKPQAVHYEIFGKSPQKLPAAFASSCILPKKMAPGFSWCFYGAGASFKLYLGVQKREVPRRSGSIWTHDIIIIRGENPDPIYPTQPGGFCWLNSLPPGGDLARDEGSKVTVFIQRFNRQRLFEGTWRRTKTRNACAGTIRYRIHVYMIYKYSK